MKTPDVNVLLYAVNHDCAQHDAARLWLEQAFAQPGGVGFAWNALLGFLRLSTKAGVFAKPLGLEDAFRVMHEWLEQPGAQILQPMERHAQILARLLMPRGTGGNLVSDAHLAAVAIEHGAALGSFDGDFEQFAGLRFEKLRQA